MFFDINKKNRFYHTTDHKFEEGKAIVSEVEADLLEEPNRRDQYAMKVNKDTLKNVDFLNSPQKLSYKKTNSHSLGVVSPDEMKKIFINSQEATPRNIQDVTIEPPNEILNNKSESGNIPKDNSKQNIPRPKKKRNFRSFAHSSKTSWVKIDPYAKTTSVRMNLVNFESPENSKGTNEHNGFPMDFDFHSNSDKPFINSNTGLNDFTEPDQHVNRRRSRKTRGNLYSDDVQPIDLNNRTNPNQKNSTGASDNLTESGRFEIKRIHLTSDMSVDKLRTDFGTEDDLGVTLGPSNCIIPGVPYNMENEIDKPSSQIPKSFANKKIPSFLKSIKSLFNYQLDFYINI
jgi:hypothetical protein